jgi:hypothetical protein
MSAVSGSKFRRDVVDMLIDGPGRDPERNRYFFRRGAFGGETHHFLLSRGQGRSV